MLITVEEVLADMLHSLIANGTEVFVLIMVVSQVIISMHFLILYQEEEEELVLDVTDGEDGFDLMSFDSEMSTL